MPLLSMTLIILLIAFYVSGTLATLASDSMITARRSYTATFGSLAGLMSYGFLRGYTLVLDFLDVCIRGYMGLGGYVFIIGLASMLGVWTFNIYQHKGMIQ